MLACVVTLAAASSGLAQRNDEPQGIHPVLEWDGERPHPNDFDPATVRSHSRFTLFGLADVAVVGMRGRGSMTHKLTNTSPIDYYFELGYAPVYQEGTAGGTMQMFFEGPLWAGTPAGEWEKHRQVVPSLNDVVGGGYNSVTNVVLLTGATAWRPKDGQLGLVTSGTAATADGACTDFTRDRVTAGAPLGAASDCPVTWGSDQFQGAGRRIDYASWVDYFNEVTAGGTVPQNFSWDWWRVPDQYVSDSLIGDFQTYGEIVDWASDHLARYGGVVPGGIGPPRLEGYPLGLTFKFDAFSFGHAPIANATYWRATVVNESEKVYGVGLDYDSLYIGQMPEPLSLPGVDAMYWRPELGALLIVDNGVNPTCNGAATPSGVYACAYPYGGFYSGASAIIVLNSPIGDLRNKLFSDETSPFYAPGHPNAGDTITFNHGHLCGYGGCWSGTVDRSARSGFGMFASRPADMLDGRTVSDFTDSEYFRIFRNWDFPVRSGQFNRYITPEAWRYTNRPPGTGAGPDTLYFDSCISSEFNTLGLDGCSEFASDTLPGGLNNRYCNISAGIGIGPFPLAAGDTTKFTLAIITGPNEIEFREFVREVPAQYMIGWDMRPAPAPAPAIASVKVVPAEDGDPEVTLVLSDTLDTWVDPYLMRRAALIRDSDLDESNPGLADTIVQRAGDNVRAIHVYRSCDDGRSFSASADCRPDPLVDERGEPVKHGWRPYMFLERAEDGRFAKLLRDRQLIPGRTYTYVLVSETRGVELPVAEQLSDGRLVGRMLPLAPSFLSPLDVDAEQPHVAKLYVPRSRVAGEIPAELQITEDDTAGATLRYHPTAFELLEEPDTGVSYRLVFGDSLHVTETYGSDPSERHTRVVTYRQYRVSYDSLASESDNPAGVTLPPGALPEQMLTDTTREFGIRALTTLALTAEGEPLFASWELEGEPATPHRFLLRSDFPGWRVSIENPVGAFAGQIAFDARGAELDSAEMPSIHWLSDLSTGSGYYGEYTIIFEDSEYGPLDPQALSPGRSPLDQWVSLEEALEARQVACRTTQSPEVAALLEVPEEELADVAMPFAVEQTLAERSVLVAILRSAKIDSMTLVRGNDTTQVPIPEEYWLPGDELIFIESVPLVQTDTAGNPLIEDGQLVTEPVLQVTWPKVVLGCSEPRPSCDPVAAPGSNGHRFWQAGQKLSVRYYNPITSATRYAFSITPRQPAEAATRISDADFEQIRVVPNPYVLFSRYETAGASGIEPRIMFTRLPPQGTIEIYNLSGHFVQRITYGPQDLSGNGDLFWDLRTRGGRLLASGLYIFVLEAQLPASGRTVRKIGKFVVIR